MFFRKKKRIEELENQIKDLQLEKTQAVYIAFQQLLVITNRDKAIEGLKTRLKTDKRYHALYDLAVKRGKKLATELNQAKNALANYQRVLSDLGYKMNSQQGKIDGVLKK